MNIILEIPNQQFCFMDYEDCEVNPKKDLISIGFTELKHGSIFLVTDVVEGDEDALIFFGLPDGENQARIAFWHGALEFTECWNKLLATKTKWMNTQED